MSKLEVPRGALATDIERRLLQRLDHLAEVFGASDTRSDQAFDRAIELADWLQSSNEDDTHRAAQLTVDLWDRHDPADAASPLGITLARTSDLEHQPVTRAHAGAVLGVGRGQVHNLIQAGQLQSVGRSVTRGSIADRLLDRRSHRQPYGGTP